MKKDSIFVGLDVHKEKIAVAMLVGWESKPVEWTVRNEPRAVRRLSRKLKGESVGDLVCAYEAGPCGYALQRQLQREGIGCQVVAPSLIPVKPGERIKTDRRDARKLAEMLRAGLLREVHAPSEEEESVRDLCRAREDAREDLLRCRHRLSKMLLRRGIQWTGGRKAWTQAHRTWLNGIRLERAADAAVWNDYLLAIEQLESRLQSLDETLRELSQSPKYREPVAHLRCFRGIDTVTAMTVVSELYDVGRFSSPRELMAYLGLVPSEHSSGSSERRGHITKAGNRHVRRVLVEAAWHYRHRPGVGVSLAKRRCGQPAEVIAVADRAQQRLFRRYWRLMHRGKPSPKAVVAVARELVGFIWAALLACESAPAMP